MSGMSLTSTVAINRDHSLTAGQGELFVCFLLERTFSAYWVLTSTLGRKSNDPGRLLLALLRSSLDGVIVSGVGELRLQ